jgi:hypothetical protein
VCGCCKRIPSLVIQQLVEFGPTLLKHRVLLFPELGMFGAGFNLLESLFHSAQRIEAAFPDDGIGRFPA